MKRKLRLHASSRLARDTASRRPTPSLGQALATWDSLLQAPPFVSRIMGSATDHRWMVVELTTITELKAEGVALAHCVAGYARRCRQGRSSIFSVRHKSSEGTWHSLATIEVSPSWNRVVQLRGYRNRPVNLKVHRVVAEWATHYGIGFRG